MTPSRTVGVLKTQPGRGAQRERWGFVDFMFAAAGLATLAFTIFMGVRFDHFQSILQLWPSPLVTERVPSEDPLLVDIVILESAVGKGAVCLDGSPPAYYLDRGHGSGSKNWLVHLEGGAWCHTNKSCLDRASTHLGSSLFMEERTYFSGILSSSYTVNPDFFNWNRVKVKYCDGASFTGDVDEPVSPLDNQKSRLRRRNDKMVETIFYRGQRVWEAIMEDLLLKGLKDAEKALLNGCSAGGLASILHCDQFSSLVPKNTFVKCVSDAGFFLNVPDVSGMHSFESFYKQVVTLQNAGRNLPADCASERNVTQCFFPQYVLPHIRTPLFILNPGYDIWQIYNVLIPDSADPEGSWSNCKAYSADCSETQLQTLEEFRMYLLEQLRPIQESDKGGMFIDSCFVHCQSEQDDSWNSIYGPKINAKSPAQSVGDWYFERDSKKQVDCAYPCNPTCSPGRFKFGRT